MMFLLGRLRLRLGAIDWSLVLLETDWVVLENLLGGLWESVGRKLLYLIRGHIEGEVSLLIDIEDNGHVVVHL